MSLLPFWALKVSVALPSMQGQKALRFHHKITSFVFQRWMKVLWVWNNMTESNWWQNCYLTKCVKHHKSHKNVLTLNSLFLPYLKSQRSKNIWSGNKLFKSIAFKILSMLQEHIKYNDMHFIFTREVYKSLLKFVALRSKHLFIINIGLSCLWRFHLKQAKHKPLLTTNMSLAPLGQFRK